MSDMTFLVLLFAGALSDITVRNILRLSHYLITFLTQVTVLPPPSRQAVWKLPLFYTFINVFPGTASNSTAQRSGKEHSHPGNL